MQKLPNTERGWPAGEPNEKWTKQQLLALLKHQLRVLTGPNRRIRNAVAATDADIQEIKDDIAKLEREVFLDNSILN